MIKRFCLVLACACSIMFAAFTITADPEPIKIAPIPVVELKGQTLDPYCVLEDGTVMILSSPNESFNSGESWGTGFITHGKDGTTFIWTAAHVVTDSRKSTNDFKDDIVAVKPKLNELGLIIGYEGYKCRVVRYGLNDSSLDPAHDIAILSIEPVKFGKPLTFLANKTRLKLGTKVFHAGVMMHPSFGLFFSEGNIGQSLLTMGEDKEVFFQIHTSARPGSSGGPVINEKGELVGILTRGIRATSFHFIVPYWVLKEWADSVDATWAYDPTVDVPDDLGPAEPIPEDPS